MDETKTSGAERLYDIMADIYGEHTAFAYVLGEGRRIRDLLCQYGTKRIVQPDGDFAEEITAVTERLRMYEGMNPEELTGLVRKCREDLETAREGKDPITIRREAGEIGPRD